MKTYFKHSIITSGKQEDVEKEINVFSDSKYSELVSVNVTPERIGIDDCGFPNYWYHVSIVYKEKENEL